MEARMKNPALVLPDALQALQAINGIIEKGGVSKETLGLVHMRISQINGCSVCIDMHSYAFGKESATDKRLLTVAAWRDTPYFTDAERAALALAEAVTRLSDSTDPVPDAIWNEAARHYNEQELASLILGISMTNVWNRLNVTTKQVAGQWRPGN